MHEDNLFSDTEKTHFTQLRINDIEQAKSSWLNCSTYVRNAKELYFLSKSMVGSVFFKSSMLTEDLSASDFGTDPYD